MITVIKKNYAGVKYILRQAFQDWTFPSSTTVAPNRRKAHVWPPTDVFVKFEFWTFEPVVMLWICPVRGRNTAIAHSPQAGTVYLPQPTSLSLAMGCSYYGSSRRRTFSNGNRRYMGMER